MTELKFNTRPNPYEIKTHEELGAFLKKVEDERAADDALSLEEWTQRYSANWESTDEHDEQARTFTAAQRRSASKSGASLPDGSYPIFNATDAMNALRRIGTGKASKATILAHIRKRAKALGFKAPGSAGQPATS